MSSAAALTLPSVLSSGPALHALVRVELTNDAIIVGRLLEIDAATMNLKLDAISSTAVRRRAQHAAAAPATTASHSGDEAKAADTIETSPIALRCVQGMVIRGACVRFLDFIHESKDGGTSYGEVLAAAQTVRPSE